jgi:hypothetical protein
MNFELPPIGGADRTPPPKRPAAAGKPAAEFSLPAQPPVSAIPPSPPADVLDEMYTAAKVADKLRAQERELHFEPSDSGRVVIQVRDLDGKVIRTVPPSQALDIAAGAPLD